MAARLRHSAIRGGAFVAGRQAATLVVGLAGTIALTRMLGPAGYGQFAAALALVTYAGSVAQLGLNAWLVRREAGETMPRALATARTLLAGSAVCVAAIGALVLPLIEQWLGGVGVRPLALGLLAVLPLQMLLLVPLASLERALRFREVAFAELVGQFVLYGIGVSLVAAGAGPVGLVVGLAAQQLWLLTRLQSVSGLPFAFGLDAGMAREGLRYGVTYAATIWVWQLRELVNPLIVGRWFGVAGVGQVALAVRLVDAAGFMKAAAWRLSLPALARLQREPARLAGAVRDGMRLQLLTVGPAFLALVLVGPHVIPYLFGARWDGVRDVLPYIAAGGLANATYNLHSSALYALGRNGKVTLFHLVHVALFVAGATVLVPRFGVVGVGFAEMLALPSYFVIYACFRDAVRSADGTMPAPEGLERLLGACLVVAVAGCAWTPWAALIAGVPFLWTAVRTASRESAMQVRDALLARESD